eukprot:6552743-Ditylum_brightwellii.AAC.1
MGMKLKKAQEKLNAMKATIKETGHHIKVIQGAHKEAKMDMSYWRNFDGFKFVEWHNVIIATDGLLKE